MRLRIARNLQTPAHLHREPLNSVILSRKMKVRGIVSNKTDKSGRLILDLSIGLPAPVYTLHSPPFPSLPPCRRSRRLAA